jgi:hypothetical protein
MTTIQNLRQITGGGAEAMAPVPVEGRRKMAGAGILARLKGVVILGGAVRPSALMEAIGRSLLDLPLRGGGEGETLMDRWVAEIGGLAEAAEMEQLHLKVMLDAGSAAPNSRRRDGAAQHHRVHVSVQRDPFEYRGTGGVLHDVAREMADDDYLIVQSGTQLPVEPLKESVALLAAREADVAIMGHKDGTPSGLMLVRCGAVRDISDLGFVDLKEQALPVIAKKHRVLVEQREAASLTVRTARDYLAALRQDHRRRRGETLTGDVFAEDCHAEFAIVEEGAAVDKSARLLDSVVLAGGRVGAGAVLVRTIVCQGGAVKARERVVEQLVAPANRIKIKARTR